VRSVVRVAIRLVLAVLGSQAMAQQTSPVISSDLPQRDVVNAGTVTVITAPVGGPMSVMGSDMANVLDDGENLRVLPILGKGSVQNLIDIMLLRNVDMGFVVSDALEFVKTEYNVPDITSRVRYIAQLFHNDVHIVAREEIKSLRDLNGKRVFAERNIGLPAARIIFRRLGISAEIDSHTDADGGLQKLLGGDGDAWVASVGKGAPVIKNIKADGGKFHLLTVPYDKALQDVYLPESFTSDDYPNIIPSGTRVDAVAAPTVLMVYNWPAQSERYKRVARFVDALFDKIDQLQQPPRHPKWRDTVISAAVPGLQRFQPAQDWLNARSGAAAPAPTPVRAEEFRRFLAQRNGGANVSDAQAAKLYGDFLRWRDGQK
jgi:uncharacterized protein